MNGQEFLSPSLFLLICLIVQWSFCSFFLKDFQHIDWICYSRLTRFWMASNVSQLQEHDTSHGSSKIQVTILASEWGSSKGGLSTINRELAIQLAKFSCLEVTFFLPKCSDEDKKAANSHGISIVEAARCSGYNELDWLSFPPGHLTIDVVVGHGVKLGRQAQVIRESHNCKWVQVVHTDPEELGMFKGYENPISTGEEKHHVEKELCQMADFVVGVGPKLAEAFRKYLGSCKKHQDVFEFTPGVFDEFSSVQQVPDERKQCSVLVFARGDAEDFKLKGFDIAAKAVAALSDTILVFVGSPYGKQEEIATQFTDFGIPANRLRVRSYMEREALKELFYEVDVCADAVKDRRLWLDRPRKLCQLGFQYLLAKTQVLEKLLAAYHVALYLSLAMKIPVHGQRPSNASGTKTESHDLMRLRLCEISMLKDTVGLNSVSILSKRWLNLLMV